MVTQKSLRISGIMFGAWLSWLYAFLAEELNRISLPGITLPEPQGGLFGYYLGAILVGVVIGLACTWPDSTWLGALLGGIAGAALAFITPWQQATVSSLQAVGAVILTVTTFIPLALILMPVAWLIRVSANRLPAGGEGRFSIRQAGLPLLATALVVVLGVTTMHPPEVRKAFYATQAIIQQGMQARSAGALPAALQDVQGFIPNANGRYTLEWSDAVNRFQGMRPVTSRQNSDFLIVARFQNGFTMACIFAPGAKQSPCANFQ